MANSHRPVVLAGENDSLFQALRRFIPMVFIYSFRHLTVGALVRLKLARLKKKGEKWIIEE